MTNVRVGAINWDCSLPPETYFGYYQIRTLSPEKYRSITPYYADILSKNKITYHNRTVKEFDTELSYAIDAGIDYFAYVYYPDKGSREHISLKYEDCSHRVYELNQARKMHEASKLRKKIKIAAIIGLHPFADEDINELCELICRDFYEKVDGRPLVYIFHAIPAEFIGKLNRQCELRHAPKPFYVSLFSPPFDETLDYSPIDALSSYECAKTNIKSYSELCEKMLCDNSSRLEKCTQKNIKLIPHFSVGWDPSPRIDIPSPWVSYPNVDYHKPASRTELIRGAEMLSDWIMDNMSECIINHILTFAWNEFEEGAWICPTYNKDLSLNTERIAAFSEITNVWKKRFL